MKNNRSREWFQAPEYYGFARRAWLRSEGFPADVPLHGFDPARHLIENALGSLYGPDQA